MIFPPAIIIYENHFAKYKCCCCCLKTPKKVPTNDNDAMNAVVDAERANPAPVDDQIPNKEQSRLDIFFRDKWCLYVYKLRFPIIIFFVGWAIFTTIFAA